MSLSGARSGVRACSYYFIFIRLTTKGKVSTKRQKPIGVSPTKNKTQNKTNYTNTTVQNNNTKHVQQMANIETYTTHV